MLHYVAFHGMTFYYSILSCDILLHDIVYPERVLLHYILLHYAKLYSSYRQPCVTCSTLLPYDWDTLTWRWTNVYSFIDKR